MVDRNPYNAGVGGSNPSPPTTRTSRSTHAFEVFGDANGRSARREIQQKSNMRREFGLLRVTCLTSSTPASTHRTPGTRRQHLGIRQLGGDPEVPTGPVARRSTTRRADLRRPRQGCYLATAEGGPGSQLTPWKVPSVESFEKQAERIEVLAEAISEAEDIT